MSTSLSDVEFLQREVTRREHFLYVYKKGSALLLSKVRRHLESFADREGWTKTALELGASLELSLIASSLFAEVTYIACDAGRFNLDDLKRSLERIAIGSFKNHLFLMVCEGSKILEEGAWQRAKDAVGVIEEPTVSISNYRSVTRYLLKSSDLKDVGHFGENDRFLAGMKAFVQQGRSLFEMSKEIDRIILTQVKNGVLLDRAPAFATVREERRVLSEQLNQFLDEPNTATLYPILLLVDAASRSRSETHRLLVRLFRASANIVWGKDRRYKRNREGNPAVLPYLVWGMLLLAGEDQLTNGNFVVAFDQLCQKYHSSAKDPSEWFDGSDNWQDIAIHLEAGKPSEPSDLDEAREELRLALAARIRELSESKELNWLLPLLTNGCSHASAVLEEA